MKECTLYNVHSCTVHVKGCGRNDWVAPWEKLVYFCHFSLALHVLR
jgi:hypothetical protein